ncbi:hypothetical protein [Pseudoramibacter alactolyticus]|uniref:hypothetical protein n=1 Tax=Pseudoramibacter alactolyticus TaxID=113287 RepID=UPI00248E3709|nr:hypothetical protein [Pseudoramibacter alactolyticus]
MAATPEKEAICLVLSGDAQGPYTMGVARAIRSKNLPLARVIGSGAGTLAAAFIAQGKEDLARNFWCSPLAGAIIHAAETMAKRYVLEWAALDFDVFRQAYIRACHSIEINTLRQQLSIYLSEERLRRSPVALSFVTVHPETLLPVSCELSAVPEGQFLNYLWAGLLIPVFKTLPDGRRTYLEAGFLSVMPATLALKAPEPHLVAVDFANADFRQNPHHRLTLIQHSVYLALSPDHDTERFAQQENWGNTDALKALYYLLGNFYSIDAAGDHRFFDALTAFLGTLPEDPALRRGLIAVLSPAGTSREAIVGALMAELNHSALRRAPQKMVALLELTARVLAVPTAPIYAPDALILAILNALNTAVRRAADSFATKSFGAFYTRLLQAPDAISAGDLTPEMRIAAVMALSIQATADRMRAS